MCFIYTFLGMISLARRQFLNMSRLSINVKFECQDHQTFHAESTADISDVPTTVGAFSKRWLYLPVCLPDNTTKGTLLYVCRQAKSSFRKKKHNINTVLAGLICDGNNPFYFSSNTCINLLMLRSNFLRLSYHGHFKWLQLL